MIKRFQSINYTHAHLKLTIPHILTLEKGRVMMMVHVRAHKNNVDFENFSAFLCNITNNKIVTLWQVDAKPAQSHGFWRSIPKI